MLPQSTQPIPQTLCFLKTHQVVFWSLYFCSWCPGPSFMIQVRWDHLITLASSGLHRRMQVTWDTAESLLKARDPAIFKSFAKHWSVNVLCMISSIFLNFSITLNVLRLPLWTAMLSLLETFPSMRTGGRMCTCALTSFIPNNPKLEMTSVSFHTEYYVQHHRHVSQTLC